MDKKIFRHFYENYLHSTEFREWQNNLTNKLYRILQNNLRANEVTTVTELCEGLNSEKYRGITIASYKIHGSKSYVDFNYKGQETKKELADMVIISVITYEGRPLVSKTALIQNKKWSRETTWDIDQEQLYLLMNFPTFDGLSKRIGKVENNAFLNRSGTLGNYGLFTSDGEFVLTTAKSVFCQQVNKTLKFDDIKKYEISASAENFTPLFSNHPYVEDYYYHFRKYQDAYLFRNPHPFASNYSIALNAHEFIRNLTTFNIGETSFSFDVFHDMNLQIFTERILYTAFANTSEDIRNSLDFKTQNWEEKIEGNFSVIKVQMELNSDFNH